MNFPSVNSALDYVKSKLQDFYNQTWVLRDRLRAIAALKLEAQKRNDQATLGKLILATEQTKQLMNEQLALEQKLKPFADYFGVNYGSLQLGFVPIPVYLTVGAVAIASMMYLHFQKLQNQATALDLIAKGMLPADQAESILNPSVFSFSGIGSTMLPVALIVGAAFFIMRRG